MKKWITIAVLVLAVFIAIRSHSVHVLAQQNVWTETVTNQYGTYTNNVTVSYDPVAGSGLGELYQTETITGRPSNFMPGTVLHTPSATVHLNGTCDAAPNCKQTANGVPANQSPNYSRTWSFDLQSICGLTLLDSSCFGDSQDNDFCPIAGINFLNFLHGMEAEDAITTFYVHANENGGVPQCSPPSSPPDWPGLFQSPDYSDVDRTYRARNVGIRICRNPPCTGQPWIFTGPPRVYKQISNVQPPMHCTNKDKGYISDQNVTY